MPDRPREEPLIPDPTGRAVVRGDNAERLLQPLVAVLEPGGALAGVVPDSELPVYRLG